MQSCTESQRQLTGTHTFQYVHFKHCVSSYDGGAIHSKASNTVLNIENCEFTGCTAGTARGGAIHASEIKRISLISTHFHACSGFNGGALSLMEISQHFTIQQCIFSTCSGSQYGAFIYTTDCTSNNPYFTHSCSFINANPVSDTNNLSGGGISCYISTSKQKTVFHDTLFAHNSVFRGGGFTLKLHLGDTPSVQFCFFSGNYAKGGKGDDIYIMGVYTNFVCYSFTTNVPSRSIYAESLSNKTPNWVPKIIFCRFSFLQSFSFIFISYYPFFVECISSFYIGHSFYKQYFHYS